MLKGYKKIICIFLFIPLSLSAQKGIRDYGIRIGELKPGKFNAITDVKGVTVGHFTLIKGKDVRTGVTAILPHQGNIFQSKVAAAMYIGNGFGKLIGYSQVEELGNIETPIILTNTLSVFRAAEALIEYTLEQPGNENVRSVNPVAGETNDGYLNDIRGMHIKKEHIFRAIENASSGSVEQGAIGAGTGTICFGYKGGIGTSSRRLDEKYGGYTIGVLVQTNFGGNLTIMGVPIEQELENRTDDSPDGSCMIVVATDAPVGPRNLKRLAKRAVFGLARTGGIGSNGSGDYVIAFSTAEDVRIPYRADSIYQNRKELFNRNMTPLFDAVIEAAEEAILNSLFRAVKVKDVSPLPVNQVISILKSHKMIQE